MLNKTASIFVCGVLLSICSVAAEALPISPRQVVESNVLQVAGGCGIGFHRSVYGYCVRNGYVAAPYYAPPVVVVPPPYYAAPVRRACPYPYRLDVYGQCVP